MADDDHIKCAPAPDVDAADGARERRGFQPITPDDEPSALERGVRIFERLRRRP